MPQVEAVMRMMEEMTSIMLSLDALISGKIESIRVKGTELVLGTADKVAGLLQSCLFLLECLVNCNQHFEEVVTPTVRRTLDHSLRIIPL